MAENGYKQASGKWPPSVKPGGKGNLRRGAAAHNLVSVRWHRHYTHAQSHVRKVNGRNPRFPNCLAPSEAEKDSAVGNSGNLEHNARTHTHA